MKIEKCTLQKVFEVDVIRYSTGVKRKSCKLQVEPLSRSIVASFFVFTGRQELSCEAVRRFKCNGASG